MTARCLLLLAAAAALAAPVGGADARPEGRGQHDRQEHRKVQRDERRAAAAAARLAQQKNGGGRVLAVDPDGEGYRVKLLKDGEVRTFHIVVE